MWWFRILVLVALAALVHFLRNRRATPELPGVGGSDGELDLGAETVAIPGGRRFHLSSKYGAVDLVLLDAMGDGPFAFGEGRLEPRSLERGAGFVADVAAWLGRPTPPRYPGKLAMLPFSYARLGTRDGWEANKLFLHFGAHDAEVYLNVAPDGSRVRLLEKDAEYASDLLAVLAIAVRDGVPARRSARNDEFMETDQPVFANPTRLATRGEFQGGVWSGTGFIVFAESNDRHHIVHWKAPGAEPTPIGTVAGIVTTLVPAPRDARVVAVVVHPERAGSYSSEDPVELVLFEPGKNPRSLLGSDVEFKLSSHASVLWSPDGTSMAVSAPGGKEIPRKRRVRIIDVGSAEMLHTTERALDLDTEAWTTDGLMLVRREFAGADFVEIHYSWAPKRGRPQKIAAPAGISSPDGRFVIAAEEGGVLVVRGPKRSRRFASQSAEDRKMVESLREMPTVWCGPHHLVLETGDPVVLDLSTLNGRLLFPAPGWTLAAASPDGSNVLCTSPDGAPHWGTATK